MVDLSFEVKIGWAGDRREGAGEDTGGQLAYSAPTPWLVSQTAARSSKVTPR